MMPTSAGSIRDDILFQPTPDTAVSKQLSSAPQDVSRPLAVPLLSRNKNSSSASSKKEAVVARNTSSTKRAASGISTTDAAKNLVPSEEPLPVSFEPTPYTVIVGRNSEAKENLGNKRLRVLASNYVSAYNAAHDRRIKTEIVNEIRETILKANGHFIVKKKCGSILDKKNKKDGDGDDGLRWFNVADAVAREKIGYVLRDLLSHKYKSSSKSKVEKKRLLKKKLGTRSSSSSSSSKHDQGRHPFLLHHVVPSSARSTAIPSPYYDAEGRRETTTPHRVSSSSSLEESSSSEVMSSCSDSTTTTAAIPPKVYSSSLSPVSTVDIDLSAEDCVLDDVAIFPPMVMVDHCFVLD